MNELFGNVFFVTFIHINLLDTKNTNLSLHRHVDYKDTSCKISDALYK